MVEKSHNPKSVLVVGFNTRPLAYSLNRAGYDVYAVDFFVDIDLTPFFKDQIIITKELGSNFQSLKDNYGKYLCKYAKEMLRKYKNLDYLLIGSGLDNDYTVRKALYDEVNQTNTSNLNNTLGVIEKTRNIEYIFDYLDSHNVYIPKSFSWDISKFGTDNKGKENDHKLLTNKFKENQNQTNTEIKRRLIEELKYLFDKRNTPNSLRGVKIPSFAKRSRISHPPPAPPGTLRDVSDRFIHQKLHRLGKPFILKKKKGAGGNQIYKIDDFEMLTTHVINTWGDSFVPNEWLLQEYIRGIPVSCTIISNGEESEILSINRQIIGEKILNSPMEFMYCGNIVPANLSRIENLHISEISNLLVKKLKLKGINGFDFVLRDHYPYLMEINPRIPGSIRASEEALDQNLLQLHIDSFNPDKWKDIKRNLRSKKFINFTTKLVYFAPINITSQQLMKINNIENVHDKTKTEKGVEKGEPVCTVLCSAKNYQDSYEGAFNTILKIRNIINEI